ncbi:MAG: Conjugative transposon protein TraM [Cytophagales bacterium]|jgi:conjugative transposon TraM protein|nr:conjugative transposon protein TraM [Bacteroidota bacterium]MBS1980725.1 conjugative transposon protein TraM [Bacteroidota bacterium]WHZ08062.1 MAG: Conjugative transposon protein TraM [Cytophagales bacterium]
MKPHSQKFLQQRKFAMVVPVLVLPFLILIFWALGGGQGSPGQAIASEKTGLNPNLPDAHFNDEVWNKLSLYEQAERDSLKLEEEKRNDPYIDLAPIETQDQQEIQQEPIQDKQKTKSGNSQNVAQKKQAEIIDPNEAKVNKKLEQLYQELNKKQDSPIDSKTLEVAQPNATDPQFSSDVKQLEKMMQTMKGGNQDDPEMQQINGMLEKILDIQHPDRAAEKIRKESELKKGQVFPVQTKEAEEKFSLLTPKQISIQIPSDSLALLSKVFPTESSQNGFYGLEDEMTDEQETGNTIEAAVHDTQELVAGSTIKLRLLNDVYINGKHISKDQFIYGTCSINGERLTVAINSIRDENFLFPVSLSAYDLDGIEGIYIPGAITRDVAKQSSDQALQGMQFMSMDQSLKTQAASAGIQTAKSLFSKKVKLIKVTVKAGYKLLLKDKKTDNS